jgi:hypothetical protein
MRGVCSRPEHVPKGGGDTIRPLGSAVLMATAPALARR